MNWRITYATLYLAAFSAAYFFSLYNISLILSFLHYVEQAVFHIARIVHFADRQPVATYGFKIWNGVFICVRLASIFLSVLAFGISTTLKTAVLLSVCALQAYLMWGFVHFHIKRMREQSKTSKLQQTEKKEKKKDKVKRKKDAVSELPEVDQNTRARRSRVQS